MAHIISVDYLVVGAGAMGMAFVDTLLSDTQATAAIVDRYHRPGGHWNLAYPFVHLHQPSSFYGVNSKPLGRGAIDKVGWNKGLQELATSNEVSTYYSQVLDDSFLPSGRVQYFPNCEYNRDGTFHSLVTGKFFRVTEATRVVDATYLQVIVPAMRPPSYEVEGAHCITPNDLAKISRPFNNYTIVGAGKTGIDACLWLLQAGVQPSQITWIMPRDSWLLDRAAFQTGEEFVARNRGFIKNQAEAVMAADSVEDLFRRLEKCGHLLRLSDKVWPKMYRCATVSLAEFEQLKKIENIVRMGRVKSISSDQIVLESGVLAPKHDTLYVDCSAEGLTKAKPVPVFNGNKITLQSVRQCQQVFSAAFIAHIEAAYDDEKVKNALCQPIPHPNDWLDWLRVSMLNQQNALRWNQEPRLVKWLRGSRLDWFGKLQSAAHGHIEPGSKEQAALASLAQMLIKKLEHLLAERPHDPAEDEEEPAKNGTPSSQKRAKLARLA
ncbi:hypothetical protein MBLNU13_g03433t1 [Cladosporium sp. NU13]